MDWCGWALKSVRVSLYSVRMQENMDQKNSEYGHYSRSAWYYISSQNTLPLTIDTTITDEHVVTTSLVEYLKSKGRKTFILRMRDNVD